MLFIQMPNKGTCAPHQRTRSHNPHTQKPTLQILKRQVRELQQKTASLVEDISTLFHHQATKAGAAAATLKPLLAGSPRRLAGPGSPGADAAASPHGSPARRSIRRRGSGAGSLPPGSPPRPLLRQSQASDQGLARQSLQSSPQHELQRAGDSRAALGGGQEEEEEQHQQLQVESSGPDIGSPTKAQCWHEDQDRLAAAAAAAAPLPPQLRQDWGSNSGGENGAASMRARRAAAATAVQPRSRPACEHSAAAAATAAADRRGVQSIGGADEGSHAPSSSTGSSEAPSTASSARGSGGSEGVVGRDLFMGGGFVSLRSSVASTPDKPSGAAARAAPLREGAEPGPSGATQQQQQRSAITSPVGVVPAGRDTDQVATRVVKQLSMDRQPPHQQAAATVAAAPAPAAAAAAAAAATKQRALSSHPPRAAPAPGILEQVAFRHAAPAAAVGTATGVRGRSRSLPASAASSPAGKLAVHGKRPDGPGSRSVEEHLCAVNTWFRVLVANSPGKTPRKSEVEADQLSSNTPAGCGDGGSGDRREEERRVRSEQKAERRRASDVSSLVFPTPQPLQGQGDAVWPSAQQQQLHGSVPAPPAQAGAAAPVPPHAGGSASPRRAAVVSPDGAPQMSDSVLLGSGLVAEDSNRSIGLISALRPGSALGSGPNTPRGASAAAVAAAPIPEPATAAAAAGPPAVNATAGSAATVPARHSGLQRQQSDDVLQGSVVSSLGVQTGGLCSESGGSSVVGGVIGGGGSAQPSPAPTPVKAAGGTPVKAAGVRVRGPLRSPERSVNSMASTQPPAGGVAGSGDGAPFAAAAVAGSEAAAKDAEAAAAGVGGSASPSCADDDDEGGDAAAAAQTSAKLRALSPIEEESCATAGSGDAASRGAAAGPQDDVSSGGAAAGRSQGRGPSRLSQPGDGDAAAHNQQQQQKQQQQPPQSPTVQVERSSISFRTHLMAADELHDEPSFGSMLPSTVTDSSPTRSLLVSPDGASSSSSTPMRSPLGSAATAMGPLQRASPSKIPTSPSPSSPAAAVGPLMANQQQLQARAQAWQQQQQPKPSPPRQPRAVVITNWLAPVQLTDDAGAGAISPSSQPLPQLCHQQQQQQQQQQQRPTVSPKPSPVTATTSTSTSPAAAAAAAGSGPSAARRPGSASGTGRASPAMRNAAQGPDGGVLLLSELQAIIQDVFESKMSANHKAQRDRRPTGTMAQHLDGGWLVLGW